jgi:hypothetical protein
MSSSLSNGLSDFLTQLTNILNQIAKALGIQ